MILALVMMSALAFPQQASAPQKTQRETVLSTRSPQFLAKRLVGSWENAAKDEAGMGEMLTLNTDGSAQLASGIIEELNYNFDGKQLIVVDADDPEDVKQVSTIALTPTHMKETNTETKESAEFVRVGEAPKSATMVGEWKRDMGSLSAQSAGLSEAEKAKRMRIAESGRYYYKADGRLLVRIPLSVQAGNWDIANDGTLRLTFGGRAEDAKVSFVNGDLVLAGPTESQTYRRLEQ